MLALTTAFAARAENSDDVLAGFVASDLSFSVAPGMRVFAGGEAAFEDDGDSVYAGRAGGAVSF